MASATSNKWAVLIGIDHYLSGSSRPGVSVTNLMGCVEDVKLVHDYLRDSLGVQDSHVYRLITPTKDQSRLPTYENIVSVLQKVTRAAEPNDLVYVHYSGHGARVRTIFSDLKGADSFDEALVPTNISCEGGRHIRDVEIAYLLQKMVEKRLIVTLVLDCCHSGSGDRHTDHGLGIRGISSVDTNRLDSDISAFSQRDLETLKCRPQFTERKVNVADHWLLGTHGYTFVAACRAQETAQDRECDGKTQGLLTHSLISTLKERSRYLTFQRLSELVALKVHEQNDRQNVVLSGEGDRLFYSGDHLKLSHAALVTKVEDPNIATLNAGEAHGVFQGMKLDVWPISCTDFSASERLGCLLVNEAEGLTIKAELVEKTSDQCLSVGCLALPRATLSVQRPVRLLQSSSRGEDRSNKNALDAVREAWRRHGTSFAPLLDDFRSEETFQVKVQGGGYHVLDKRGQQLQHMVPPLLIDAEHAAEKLVHRLTHLAKFFNVMDLKNIEGGNHLSWLTVNLTRKPYAFPKKPRLVTGEGPPSVANQVYKQTADEWLLLRVSNKLNSALNITVMDLDSSWAVAQIYPPTSGAAYETLDAKQTLYLPLQLTAAAGDTQSRVLDTIMVFATLEATSFRWLELPELDHETPLRGDAPDPRDVVEVLGATMTIYDPERRKVRTDVSMPMWAVHHVTVENKSYLEEDEQTNQVQDCEDSGEIHMGRRCQVSVGIFILLVACFLSFSSPMIIGRSIEWSTPLVMRHSRSFNDGEL